jgi:uncharacterized CHY-type Zn-finger protein
MTIGVQHKYEKVETAKILCGACNNIWYVRSHATDDIMECPNCKESAIMMRVEHIVTKGLI